jgi:hypothetical protein
MTRRAAGGGRRTRTRTKRRGLTIIHAPIRPVPDPWTPVTMLEEFLAKVKSGEIEAVKGMMVFYLTPTSDNRWRPNYWTTGLTSPEIIAFCEVLRAMAVKDWRGDD